MNRIHITAASLFVAASTLISSSVFAASPARPIAPAPAASIIVSPGSQAGAVLLGAFKLQSFGSHSNSITADDLFMGITSLDSTPSKNRINFYNNDSTPGSGVKSGDCDGNWDTSGANSFVMEYQPATSDRLTITLSNTSVVSSVNCSLIYNSFTTAISTNKNITTSLLVPLMNYIEVSIKRDSNSYTSTLSNLTLNGATLLGTFNPSGTSTKTSNITGFHLGDGFKLSGTLELTGTFGACAGSCAVEVSFGTLPSQITVQKTVSGLTPPTAWQFAGPKGNFSVPAIGGTSVITPLGSATYAITETTKPGYVTSTSCTDGSNGSNIVSLTPNAGATITCTFSNVITPTYLTETVKPSQIGAWAFAQEGANGSGAFVAGPVTPPLSDGSAQLSVDSTGREILYTPTFTGTRLDEINFLRYSTYVSAGNPASDAPVLQLNVDYTVTDVITNWQGRLTFEPYMSGTVTQDTWQTWDPLQGMWWASGAPGNTVCPQASPCTWQQVLVAFPDAGIHNNYPGVMFRAGGPWAPGFTGHVDAFTIGVGSVFTTYDYEPETPCTAVCYADAINGNDLFGGGTISNPKKTIQAAIDTVAMSGTVRVLPGTYSETAANRTLVTGGTYQFGLFFPASRPGISVIGVTAGDAPITSFTGALATINTNATNGFGPSGIFIEGDNITLQGLRIGTNSAGLNKTIEVIGDNVTLKALDIADPEGSVYINDFRFDGGTNTSHVKAYTIDGNRFAGSASLDIASGAGYSGPVSGRKIINNVFEVGNTALWPVISFNGSGTGVPWFTYGIGGAVIQGNTFSGGSQYIRIRGDHDTSQFDWGSFWNDNTYDKAVMVVSGPYPPYTPSVYTYTAGGYTFTNVSRIVSTIQEGVNIANPGETVLAKPGTYTETLSINKPVTVAGDGGNVKLQSLSPGVIISTSGVTLNNLAINGTGTNNGVEIAVNIGDTTLKFITVTNFNIGLFLNSGGAITNTLIEDSAFLSNTTHGIWSQNFNVDGFTLRRVDASYNNAAGGAGGRGVWMINGSKKNITIEDSSFINNGLVGIDLSDGEAVTVSISNNTVSGNRDSGIGAIGLRNAVVQSNTVTDNGRFGIEIKNPNGDGTDAGPNRVLVQGNTVSRSTPMTASIDGRDLAGIAVMRRSVSLPTNPDMPLGVVVRDNTVNGFVQQGDHEGFGILMEGVNSRVYGNTASGNEVGLQVQQSSGRGYPGDNDTGSAASPTPNDAWFDRANAQQTCVNIGANTLSSNSIIDYREIGSPGLMRVYNLNTAEGFCTIQQAIDDSDTAAGHTISATTGAYTENIRIPKAITLTGDVGVTIYPSTNVTDFFASNAIITGSIIYIESSDVTVKNITLDGDNPAISGGVNINGADANALRGIHQRLPGTKDRTTVQGVTVRNLGRGIDLRTGSGHLITGNTIQNTGGNADGYGILLFNEASGVVSGNAVSGAEAAGIFIQNHYVAGGITVTQNTITNAGIGLGINLVYGSAPYLFDQNSVYSASLGMQVTSIQFASLSVQNNAFTLTQPTDMGVLAWNIRPGTTQLLTNTLSGGDVGVLLTDNDSTFGLSENIANTLLMQGNSIQSANIGVQVYAETATRGAVLTATGNTISGNLAAGVHITGTGQATVTVNNNNLIGNGIGISNTTSHLVNGTLNWWNAANGPGAIAGGSGDKVSANVTYCAWLNAPAPGGSPFYPVTNLDTAEGFCTIQAAIDDSDTAAGHTISVTAGVYNEQVNVSKVLTITGAGSGNNPAVDTIVQGAGAGNGFALVNGTSATQRQVLQNLRVAGFVNGITAGSYSTLDSITAISNTSFGLLLNPLTDLRIANSHIDGNGDGNGNGGGLRVGTAANVDGLTVTNSTFDGNGIGWYLAAGTPANSSTVQNVVVQNTTFNNNLLKGIYAEKLEDALFQAITVTNSGISTTYGFNNGIDINLKYGAYQNIFIYDSSITGSGAQGSAANPTNPAAVAIKARDDAPSYNTVPATLDNVVISRTVISGPVNGIRFGEFGKTNATPTNARVNFSSLDSNASSFGLVKNITATLDASCSWWQDATGPSSAAGLNPGGLGRALTGTNTSGLDFNPWLLSSDLDGLCNPATLVIEKVVTGATPVSAWQFTGPTGTITLPAAGGSITLTNLDYGMTPITETVKSGFVASASCTGGATGSNVVTPTLLGSATVTCTFSNVITPTYTTITVTPAITHGWVSFVEPSPGTAYLIPFDIQSVPAPALGIGTPRFELTATNVGKLYGAAILTGTKISDLLVLTYSTYLEPGGQVPSIQIGWDDDATDANTGFRGRLVFVPNAPSTGVWQTWNALSDSAGTWYTTLAGACNISGSGCNWSTILATFPNATIHGNPSIPYGFVGVKAGSGGAGTSYFDGLTIAGNASVVTYDFEPACNPYRVFNVNTTEGFCTIQQAIDDSDTAAGHTISVTAGIYTEAVNINRSNLYLIGASGAASTTIVGPKSGAGNDTVLFSAPGVTVDGFTITRDGNNPADWASNVRNQGVNMASTGGTLKNSIVTANRNGVLITYADTQVISNNIANNRTGIHIQGSSPNVMITNNIITGNWTIGILFRQDTSNNTGWLIKDNRVTENWYSQLEDRGNPAGLTRTIESNYWGLSPFTIAISYTSGEPGYAGQIPVQFGGSAVPPASTPVFVVNSYDPNPSGDPGGIGNLNTTRLDFEPWLCDGADTSPAIGFQPNTTTLCDATPPDTFISSAPISPTASNSATFVFSGTDTVTPIALLTFECSLDGGTFGACSSPKNYTGLADGLRTFAVRAVDPAGMTDTTPATHTWLVDATAPDTSITSAPISPTAAITSVFTFTGTDGSGTGVVEFQCRLNGSAWSACASPITYTSGLSEGLNTFDVRAVDAVSNTDATPATHTWVIDTTGPDTTITSMPAMTTSAPYATFAFTGTDVGGTGVAGFECSLDGVAFTTCVSPQILTGITNGLHTFAVRAVDAVGNVDSTPASFTWLVDLVAPVTSITSAPASPTNTTSATLVFTGTDTGGSGIAFFEYRLDGGAWLSTTSTTVNYTGLGNGTHQFDVRAVDNVGNVDLTYATTTWTVDAVAPNTSITSAPASLELTSTATLVFTGTDAGGSGVAYYSYALDGGAALTTTSTTLAFTSLSDGPHTFTVAAVDNVGNADPTPASASWTIDTAAPDTTITLTPTTPTSSTAVTIPFTGSDSGSGVASFMCKLDGGSFAPCISPANLIGLSDGSHTFSVYAIDNVGNADPTPASVTWTVDATAPDTSITSAPAPQTNTASATFVFTGTDSGAGVASFECQLDGGAWASCTSPKSYTSLSEGTHTFMVRALDAVSNIDPTPASFTWLVDTVAPDAIITVAPAALISSTSASVTFTATDGAGSGVASFECKLDGGSYGVCTSPAALSSLGDGLHMFDVRAIDNVGNVETSPASAAFTVDATPPTTTIDIAPPAIDSSNASISFSGGDGSGSGVAGFECKLDAGAWTACASPVAYLGLSAGSHTFEVRAVDNAGNADASPASHTWMVDGDLPNTTITPTLPAATTDTSVTIVFTGTDATTPASALTFECSFDGSVFSACTSPFTQTALAQGTHTFQVRAIDEGSNTDPSPATTIWLVDTAAPDTTITSAPPAITSSNTAVISFVGTDALAPAGSLTFECSVDGSAWAACTAPVALTGLSNGSHTFAVRAIDTAGNVDATPASTSWLVDATAPDTSITSMPDNPTGETSASFTFSSTGSLSAVTYECRLDGGAWANCLTPHGITGLSDGSHTLEVRATSAASLTDATPAAYTWVVDATAPDTTITAQPPAVSGSSVSFSFTGSDAGSGVASFECKLDAGAWAACTSPQTYAGLADGNHTFMVRAIDNAGNADPTPATATWQVNTSLPDTLLIGTPPLHAPSSSARFTFIGTDDNTPSSAMTFECRLDGGAWAACTSPKSYTGLTDGVHVFDVRAIDAGSNADPTPASFTWTVDTVAPDTTITDGPTGTTSATSALFAFTGSDGSGSGVASFECRLDGGAWAACSSPKLLTALADGTHVFEVRAIDQAGNVDATPASRTWEVKSTDLVLKRRLHLPIVYR